MRDVYVAGVAMTRFAKQPDRRLRDLVADAVRRALPDGLRSDAVDLVFFANAIAGSITGQEMVAGQVALRSALGHQGTPIINVENACASGGSALFLGWQAIRSGSADRVLCVGAEKMTHPDKTRPLLALGRAVDVEEVFGEEGPQNGDRSFFMDLYAKHALEYMRNADATQADFAAVAAKNHANGLLNPNAQYGSVMTVAEVLAAREIVFPLTLPMCSPVSDGAAAVLLSVEPPAGRPTAILRAVAIASSASDTRGGASAIAARRAFALAGITPEQLDLVELHDATASAEVELYETLGLAEQGGGPELLRSGATARGGRIPVNVSGGLLAKGHPVGATGIAQIVESTLHLSGLAGERQVEDARWALTQNAGGWIEGDNAAASVAILERAA
jgi:acetyl-CoA acetyltransferase